MGDFTVREISIPHMEFPDGDRIGIMNVQMPEQEEGNGVFRIKASQRGCNRQIVRNALSEFRSMTFSNGRQATFLVFPELSLTLESTLDVIDSLKTDRTNRNSVIILGVEELTTDQFCQLLQSSDNQTDFPHQGFGKNIRTVNTAVILTKESNGRPLVFCQPKLSASRYESKQQFKSNHVYVFDFGGYRTLVSICSDFLLVRDRGPILSSLLDSLDEYYRYPAREKINLWFLIQKNPHPSVDTYEKTLKVLHYKEGHKIDTTKTVVCTLNSAVMDESKYFRNSHVAVMDRGRPPDELVAGTADQFFAWKQFNLSHGERDILRYVLWRLRYPGMISFLLNLDETPYRGPIDENSIPIEQVSIRRISGDTLVDLTECPEIYELKEVILQNHHGTLLGQFRHAVHKHLFGSSEGHLASIDAIFVSESPKKTIETMTCIHKESRDMANCDQWHKHDAALTYFLMSLRLLHVAFENLRAILGRLDSDGRAALIIDCEEMQMQHVLEKEQTIRDRCRDVSTLLLQRIELYGWDGRPCSFDQLVNNVKVTKARRTRSNDSIAISRSPNTVSFQHLISSLNDGDRYDHNPEEKTREVLRECFQCR